MKALLPFAAAAAVALALELTVGPASLSAAVLTDIRLPRALLAALVGSTLGCAGAAMQALFRNPLVEPGLVGVSNGAATGAVLVIVLCRSAGPWAVPVAAFAGGLVACAAALRLARRDGQTPVATLLLCGVAVGALCNAGTGLALFGADDARARTVTFWLLGSLNAGTWDTLRVVAPPMLLALVAFQPMARTLDLLVLGEAEAGHTGVAVERIKLAVAALAALGVGAATAATGVIGFVGLVVPHLVRALTGAGHRLLLPGAALLGAALVLLADVVARTVVAPAELPIGVLTALAGAPFLLGLLRRQGLA